jgi:hypothetical protein
MGLAGGQHEKRLEIYFLETIPFTFFSEELMALWSFLLEAPYAMLLGNRADVRALLRRGSLNAGKAWIGDVSERDIQERQKPVGLGIVGFLPGGMNFPEAYFYRAFGKKRFQGNLLVSRQY